MKLTQISDQDVEYWKLYNLVGILNDLSDLFIKAVVLHKVDIDYINILLFSYNSALLTMKEIIVLLNAGFPDGALARARNIFEQMCIISFFEKRKEDDDFEQMVFKYREDQNISYYTIMLKWHEFFNQKEEKSKIEKDWKRLQTKYGSDHARLKYNRYWWAGVQSFNQLQKDKDWGLLKILYDRACWSSHAGAMADFALLGRSGNTDGKVLDSTSTAKGFAVPLLLGLQSFILLTEYVFGNLQIDYSYLNNGIQELIGYYIGIFYLEEAK